MSIYLILMAVVLVSVGQVLQKLAATEIELGNGVQVALTSLIKSPNFWRATIAMIFGLVVWLLALADVEISKAYPILALNFGVTTILSVFLLNETVTGIRWIGIALISIGAAIMVSG